jgi:hypothetical protein
MCWSIWVSTPQRLRLVQDMLAHSCLARRPVTFAPCPSESVHARRVTSPIEQPNALPRSFPSPFRRPASRPTVRVRFASHIVIGVSTPTLSHISRAPQTPPPSSWPVKAASEEGKGGIGGGGGARRTSHVSSLHRDVIPRRRGRRYGEAGVLLGLAWVFGLRVARQYNLTSPLTRQLTNVKSMS